MSVISRIRLIQFRAGYNLPVHVGREQEIFERHGLEIDITYTPGSLFLSEALRNEDFEIGHTGADDIIADVEEFGGGPSGLFIFMGLHSGLLSVVGAPGMMSIESLRGRELAVDARASGFVFILEKLLHNNGFGPGDYRFVEIGGVDRRYRALLEGKVAGTILLPPFAGNAVTQGCRILARGDQIMAEYQGTVGAAQRSWAETNSGLLVSYIRAYVEATKWCFDVENRPTCLALLGKYHDLEGKAAEETLNTLLDSGNGMYPNAAVNIPGLKSAIELRAEMGFLKPPLPSVEKFVDLSYYDRAVGQR